MNDYVRLIKSRGSKSCRSSSFPPRSTAIIVSLLINAA